MARKQPEVTAQTRRNFIDAYWDLYSSDRADKITVRMITDRAGYNRGTFYAYFSDIDDLHQQMENELLPSEENFEKLKKATVSKNSREILEIFTQMDQTIGEKLSFLLGPKGSLSFQSKLKSTLKHHILKSLPLNLKDNESVVDYKTEILCAIFYETIRYWYDCGNRQFTAEEMTTLMLQMIFSGLVES
jgi:AcrR family transcriptional regulator